MLPFRARFAFLVVTTVGAAACAGEGATTGDDQDITSNAGTPVELRFSGEVTAAPTDAAKRAIAVQLQYTQGILTTAERANGQAGMPTLTNVTEVIENGKKKIRYDAALAVVWPRGSSPPSTYELALPRDVTALSDFNAKYDGLCGNNEYGQETFWHDFNPKAAGCIVDDGDVHRTTATVTPHPQATTGKYPEYDQIWMDDTLDVVSVFGIISGNTPSDDGAVTRQNVLAAAMSSLREPQRVEGPATPGILAESTVSGKITIDGRERRVNVTGILVQEVRSAGPAFVARYGELSAKADYVTYYGHSGLGTNINALARSTGAEAGKYQLVYLYGCNTLAYLEPTMHDKRRALNGAADPEGTKFLDIVSNALPAYGDQGTSIIEIYRALLAPASPKTFNDLVARVSSLHLVAVFGEHDNTFQP